MPENQLPEDLPSRPTSAFAASTEVAERGKDGRKLGGCTSPEFNRERWTPEAREAQRQKMRALIAEGKVGGQNGFHRRKTKKAQEILAERFQQRADEIGDKLDAMIFGQHKDKRLQLEAIREYAKFEDWAVKNSREDEKAFRAMTNQQLDAALIDMLGEAIGLDLSELIEADVVDGEAIELDAEEEALVEQVVAEMEEDDSDEEYDPMDGRVGGDALREWAESQEHEAA